MTPEGHHVDRTNAESATHLDALGTFERLREAYFRYYDTPFGLADAKLMEERRSLLDRDRGVYRMPLLELRPEYVTTGRSLDDSVASTKADPDLAAFAAAGLIPPGRDLYQHQEEALRAGVRQGRNMVITAGTGSGKTESFLLPILSSLLEESRTWQLGPAPAQPDPWWKSDSTPFITQRSGESGREAAVRAIILYPMNALVDDQLMRLRKALDSEAARRWLDDNRLGHRFYFGRYTGATPVTGRPTDNRALSDLQKYLRQTERRSRQAREKSLKKGQEDVQYFVPRLDGAEMRSRWDMTAAPPDILITNYSMLNVMLLRERDGHFFDSTKAWLHAREENRFTLVVDELHMYRGTAGTEVGYLIRNLKHRLGITQQPHKLRILAASASLDPSRDRAYLREFFGADADTFDFIQGQRVEPDQGRAGTDADARAIVEAPHSERAQLARNLGLTDALRLAFQPAGAGAGAELIARPAADLAGALFPGAPENRARMAFEGLLASLSENAVEGDPRLRAHLFFRNVPGIWACSDPDCTNIPGGNYDDRRVGAIYAQPTTRCAAPCGARVLELLYCQSCGDVMLGGYTPEGATQKTHVDAMLLADVPELAKLPDQVSLRPSAANYLVYWPRPMVGLPELDHHEWTADTAAVRYAFRRSQLDPREGSLRTTNDGSTGWSFHVNVARNRAGEPRRDPETLSPFPTICPACGDDWEIRYGVDGRVLDHTNPKRQRSPIRGMRTGFEKINQVLTSELAGDLSRDDRKVIVFTDSRQDAAKLSAGLGLRHYQDLLRLLLYRELQERRDPGGDILLAKAHVDGSRTPESFAALGRLQERDSASFLRLRNVWEGVPDAGPNEEQTLISRLSGPPTLAELTYPLSSALLAMGINPGGPHASLRATNERHDALSWTSLYNWESSSPKPSPALSQEQERLLAKIEHSLLSEMLDGLFSGAGRDFESLGLGWLGLANDREPANAEPGSANGYARAALRALADQRRFQYLRDPRPEPTARLRKLWARIHERGGPSADQMRDDVISRFGDAVCDYIIDPRKVVLNPAGENAWTCSTCRRQHLNRGCGFCTKCGRPLPQVASPAEKITDYYAWKATRRTGDFRLNCAELTGQTDRVDAQARQARFQSVFLDGDEHSLPDEVDLLSVTTTMEAGVDIGALSAVVLANMPPTRFNYQQRVGRAGRRDTPVAIALTVCRGRSHDEYYFDRPAAITNEPTPKPYLALNQPEIFRRSLRAETLRMAFRDVGAERLAEGSDIELTGNVHGAFGRVQDWNLLRAEISTWLSNHMVLIEGAAYALAEYTPLQSEAEKEARDCAEGLIGAIDAATAADAGHGDLSQRLAESGVLPMFGFPSSVRYLHLKRPYSAYPWPPPNVIDRDLSMAVGQFAPLSEVVRDGKVYPVVGIAAFRPTRPRPTPETDPLGPQRLVRVCRSCSYLAESVTTAADIDEPCPRCGSGPEAYGAIPLREPLGFRSGYAEDFDGNFSWSARAMAARAHTDLAALSRANASPQALVYAGQGKRYVINDNSGRLFAMKQAAGGGQNWGGYVSVDAIDKDLLPESAGTGETFHIALAAIQNTDFMFLGPTEPIRAEAGLRLNLSIGRQPSGARDTSEGRRGAWYSLAFLLRTAASAFLDVQPLELAAGIYSGLSGSTPTPFAFIADTLENGAGFSSHLGQPEEIPNLMAALSEYLGELGRGDHPEECRSSCYRCLRDYGNMAYHALLDWRLARDLHDVLIGHPLVPDAVEERLAMQGWAKAYGAQMLDGMPASAARFEHHRYGTHVIIAKHPLEASEQQLIAPRIADAIAAAEIEHPDADSVLVVDTFTLDRDPRRVLEMCQESDG
jgi:ATP-dependent helicase YprA (DUF1998 family)